MTVIVWAHVAAGSVALVAGFAALWMTKGGQAHRRLGRVFFHTMVIMGLSGAGVAATTGVETSVVMGIFAAYLVVSATTAVAPSIPGHAVIALVSPAVALGLAITFVDLGRRALISPDGTIEGLPAPMAFAFAAMTALSAVSDLRWRTLSQRRRREALLRHLWRMCVALFVAAASFFLGQTQVLPTWARHPLLLAIPVVTRW